MRRSPPFAVLVAVVIGCGPGKQLPDPSVKGQVGPQPAPATPVPTKSEERAKAVVDAALRATGEGDASRTGKVTAFRSSAKGMMQRPVGGQNLGLETTREFEAVWPNACRVRIESQSLKPLTLGLRRPVIWMREGDQAVPFTDARSAEENVAIDAVGHNWLLFLVPLHDPKTIVFDAAATTVADKKYDTVRASVPGYPVFALAFTDAHLLARIEYTNFETGAWVTKVLTLAEHKSFGGIQLPTKIESIRSGALVERWTVSKWEVVDKLDETIFDPPK